MTTAIEHFLDDETGAGRVMAHAGLIRDLARRFAAVAPGGLGSMVRVANFKAGKVILHADSGAAAAKVPQLGPSLCAELSAAGMRCTSIEVRVQPRQEFSRSPLPTLKPLSAATCSVLRSTTENLPEGPLRQALEILLARAVRRE